MFFFVLQSEGNILHREIFSHYCSIEPKSDFIYHFPNNSEPNGISLVWFQIIKINRKIVNTIWFWFTSTHDSEKISLCETGLLSSLWRTKQNKKKSHTGKCRAKIRFLIKQFNGCQLQKKITSVCNCFHVLSTVAMLCYSYVCIMVSLDALLGRWSQ